LKKNGDIEDKRNRESVERRSKGSRKKIWKSDGDKDAENQE
jgi:hypothetical protein